MVVVLPRTVGPQQGVHAAARHEQIQSVHCVDTAEDLDQTRCLNGGRCCEGSPFLHSLSFDVHQERADAPLLPVSHGCAEGRERRTSASDTGPRWSSFSGAITE